MRRTLLAMLLSAGLAAGCGKKEPAPPANPNETAAPAEPAKADPVKEAAAAPVKEAAAASDKKGEEGQPRRTIEEAPKPSEADSVDKPKTVVEPAAKSGEEPAHQDAADPVAAAARLTPGPAVDLGGGAAGAAALAFMPNTTAAVFVAGSPQKLLDAFGYDALRPRLANGSEKLVAETGYDLLDPATWGELGIDLSGPAGGGAIAAEKEPYILFLTIGDRAKLDAALKAVSEKGKREFVHAKVGDAELISVADYDRNVIVIRGETFMVVGVDRPTGAMALAKQVAAQEPATSLAQAVEFTSAVKPIDGKEDMLGWVNFGLGIRMSMGFDLGDREQAHKQMIDKLFGGMSGFAMGGTVKDHALEVSGFMPLAKDAMIRRLVKKIDGLPLAFSASSDEPLLGMAVRVDPEAIVELMELSLAAEGESLDEVRAAAKEMGGVDLDKDVFGVFSGAASFVLLGELGSLDDDGFDPKKLGGALVVGLSNADGLKKLFGLAAKMGNELPPGMKIDPSGTMDLPLPTGQIVHMAIVGDTFVATTDAGIAKRIADKDTSASFVNKLTHADLKAALSRPNQAGWFLMPQRLLAMWLLVREDGILMEQAAPPTRLGDQPNGAKSAEMIAKDKEIAELKAKIEAATKTSREAETKAAEALFAQLGTLVESVEVTDGGFAFHAGEYLGGTPAELAQAIAKMAEVGQRRHSGTGAMYDELFKLENEARKLELEHDMKMEEKAK